MSIKVFGAEDRPLNPAFNNLVWMAVDVGDVFTSPLNGATVTITGITTSGGVTSVAYTTTGSFPASPMTLTVFQSYLVPYSSNPLVLATLQTYTAPGVLVRTSYRGGSASGPQWPISETDQAGSTPNETSPTQ